MDDGHLVESFWQLDQPRHLDISDHHREYFGRHEIQYWPHLQHRNQAHHRDLEMLDHLDSARCGWH